MLAVVWVGTVPTSQYPHLCYPEMYVLKGGYKSLVSSHPHLCRPGPASSGEPRSRYTKMLDPMWSEQYQRAQADYLQAWKRLTKRDKGCVHTPTPATCGSYPAPARACRERRLVLVVFADASLGRATAKQRRPPVPSPAPVGGGASDRLEASARLRITGGLG